ncbi:MAG: DUF2868 domain-containing protein, partial [Comamonadaceae bacterium]
QQLAELRPRALVLAVFASASPDRGTERFLRELLPVCGECRLWLAQAPAAPDAGPPDAAAPAGAARWQRWLAERGLNDVHAFADWADASRDPGHPGVTPTPTPPRTP